LRDASPEDVFERAGSGGVERWGLDMFGEGAVFVVVDQGTTEELSVIDVLQVYVWRVEYRVKALEGYLRHLQQIQRL